MAKRIALAFVILLLVAAMVFYYHAVIRPSEVLSSDKVEIYSLVVHHIYGQGWVEWPVLFINPVAQKDVMRIRPNEGEPIPAELLLTLSDLQAKNISFATFYEATGTQPGKERESLRVVREGGVLITLGTIEFIEHNKARVRASSYVAPTGAGGWRYLLTKIDGRWNITEAFMEWIA